MEEEEEEGGRGGDAGRFCLPAAPAAPAERTEGLAPPPQVGDGDRVIPEGLQGHLRGGDTRPPPPGQRTSPARYDRPR